MHVLVFALALACGPKAAPAPEPAPVQPPPMPLAPAEPEPEPVADVEAPLPANVDLMISLVRADGNRQTGRVVRLDRGVDVYADRGWTGDASDLKLAIQVGNTEVEKAWSELASVAIVYGGKDEIDCSLDGDLTPPMHLCTLRATATAKTVDGKSGTIETRHRWRLRYEDGSEVELHFGRLPARAQPEGADEDPALYGRLQEELLAAKAAGVTAITIGK